MKWIQSRLARSLRASTPGDMVFVQGHSCAPVSTRARYLEGRLDEQRLLHFRQAGRGGPGVGRPCHPIPPVADA